MPVLRRAAAVLATALVLPGCGAAEPELPRGWRWESFQDVEVAVPGDWGYANGDTLLGGCGRRGFPAVGRPGIAACGFLRAGTDAVEDGQFVVFEGSRPDYTPDHESGGDREIVEIGSARVIVQALPDVRERIRASVHRIRTDARGCAARDALSTDPRMRPEPFGAQELTNVVSISGCLYDLDLSGTSGDDRQNPPLLGSLTLSGAVAARAFEAIVGAPEAGPEGTGQDHAGCDSMGDFITVLLVDSDQGRSRLHLRFAGCRLNGVDDGRTRRVLVHEGTYPFAMALRVVTHYNGGFDGKNNALEDLTRDPLFGSAPELGLG